MRLAAEEQRRQAAAPVRAHHEQVAVLLGGVGDDRLPRLQALDRLRLAGDAGGLAGLDNGAHMTRRRSLLRIEEFLRRVGCISARRRTGTAP